MDDKNYAMEQARSQLDSIIEMIEALREAEEKGEAKLFGEKRDPDEIRDTILEDPLSVEVRSSWRSPGECCGTPEEYTILLCTGGPAVRIIGKLSEHCEPRTATIQYQDWFTSWETLPVSGDEEDALIDYASMFCFEL